MNDLRPLTKRDGLLLLADGTKLVIEASWFVKLKMWLLGKFSHQWSDLCDIDIVPLMTDEEVGQVLAG